MLRLRGSQVGGEGASMHVSNESLLVILLVGLVAGWLAGKVIRGAGFGILGDIVIGIIGAFIGDWLLPRLSIHLGSGSRDCPEGCASLLGPLVRPIGSGTLPPSPRFTSAVVQNYVPTLSFASNARVVRNKACGDHQAER